MTKNMIVFHLIRHGQASFGSDNYDQLSDLGAVQAQRLGEHLQLQEQAFHAVFTGTLKRHQQTWNNIQQGAQGSLNHLDAIQMAEFNELDAERLIKKVLPKMIMKNPALAEQVLKAQSDYAASKKLFEGIVNGWISGDIVHEKMGTWPEFKQRVVNTLLQLADEHAHDEEKPKHIAVVTSGGPITAVYHYIQEQQGAEVESILDWSLENSSVNRFHFNGEGLVLGDYNLCDHLDDDSRTTL